jgi:ketosteroid isomerase-like protein
MLMAQDSKVDLKAEEAAIRAIIASRTIPYTDDDVDWIGRYKRPTVGKERGEQFPDSDVAKRKNAVYATKKIERLEVAAAGDMAWEFSISHAEYDVDETPMRHESFDTGQLRVWKNVHGQWKVAARFARPLDVPFVRY